MRKPRGIFATAFCLATASQGRAAIAPWEIAGVASGALGIGISEFYKKDLAPAEPRWKTPPAIDASVRSGLVWSNTTLASTLSDVMLYGVMPTSAFLLPLATNHDYSRSALAIAEAAVFTGVVTQIAKFSFARARPYAYYGNDYSNPDSKLSFFSGHTSYSFALAVSSAMLLAESYPRSVPLIYSAALSVAALPAYLRIAGDKHYFTDVLTGAIVGSTIAYGVMQLHLRSNSTQFGDERRLVLQRVLVMQ
jgi:membrane-associated phospholipid phosphatase